MHTRVGTIRTVDADGEEDPPIETPSAEIALTTETGIPLADEETGAVLTL